MSIAEKLTTIAENEQKVYEAGKKADRSEFYDAYISGGMRNAFSGTSWNKKTFYPTRDFLAGTYCFQYHNWWAGDLYDLAARMEECGVKFTAVDPTQTFMYAHITRVPKLDSSSFITTLADRTFHDARFLVTIDEWILGERTAGFANSFYNCTALKNITVSGVIPSTINFSPCPLTVESLKSIISCLKDYSTQTPFTQTLTLKDSCKTALQADTETVEFNGQSYTYFNLISAKGWNLA